MTPWGEVFDMGETTREALGRYAGGTAPLDCGAVSEWGNGLLMRTLPLALYLYRLYAPAPMNWDDVLPVIHDVSKLTHAHPISLIACGLYCCIAYQLLSGAALNEGIWEGITCMKTRYSRHPEYAAWLDRFSRVDADTPLSLTEDAIESDGYVLHTLEAVLWCLLHTNSYRDCVLKAVKLGSDTDTVAAPAGKPVAPLLKPCQKPAQRQCFKPFCSRSQEFWAARQSPLPLAPEGGGEETVCLRKVGREADPHRLFMQSPQNFTALLCQSANIPPLLFSRAAAGRYNRV